MVYSDYLCDLLITWSEAALSLPLLIIMYPVPKDTMAQVVLATTSSQIYRRVNRKTGYPSPDPLHSANIMKSWSTSNSHDQVLPFSQKT